MWLLGEGLYYLLIRWLERRANRSFLPHQTLTASLHSILRQTPEAPLLEGGQRHHQRWFMSHPHLVLGYLVVFITVAQLAFPPLCGKVGWWAESENWAWKSQGVSLGSLFWCMSGLPYLFLNFFLIRPYSDRSGWLQCFVWLMWTTAFLSVVESWVLFVFVLSRLGWFYIRAKQELELWHL